MSVSATNAFHRSDTLLGVCEAIGQDFGINPFILRLAFAGLLFWNLWAATAIYLALGTAVLLSRLIFPSRRKNDDMAMPLPPVASNDGDTPVPFAEAA